MNDRVAVVIPAKDEVDRIATTIRACRAIPHVDLVLVVDDGSEDGTQHAARNAGAVVVRHSVNRGKASAMETGSSVVAMRDIEGRPVRIELTNAHFWDITAVNALDKVCQRLRKHGSKVEVTGLNEHGRALVSRLDIGIE